MIETPKAGMSEPGRLPSSFKAAFVGDPTCNPVALPQESYREVLSALLEMPRTPGPLPDAAGGT